MCCPNWLSHLHLILHWLCHLHLVHTHFRHYSSREMKLLSSLFAIVWFMPKALVPLMVPKTTIRLPGAPETLTTIDQNSYNITVIFAILMLPSQLLILKHWSQTWGSWFADLEPVVQLIPILLIMTPKNLSEQGKFLVLASPLNSYWWTIVQRMLECLDKVNVTQCEIILMGSWVWLKWPDAQLHAPCSHITLISCFKLDSCFNLNWNECLWYVRVKYI